MRGCGITPFFCVDKFYIHVDLFYNFTDVLFSYLVNICLLYTSPSPRD